MFGLYFAGTVDLRGKKRDLLYESNVFVKTDSFNSGFQVRFFRFYLSDHHLAHYWL